MRRIASSLGVQPGALYWHVESKQDLLTQLGRRILAGVDSPPDSPAGTDLPWAVGLRAWAHGLRRRLLSHRDGAELVASVLALRPAGLDLLAYPGRLLTGAGLAYPLARGHARTLLAFVVGHTVDEQNYRQFVDLGTIEDTGEDLDTAFAAGLDLLIGALRVEGDLS